MIDLLSLSPECFPAGCEYVNLGGVAEDAFRERGCGVDDVLAAIEHKEHVLIPQEGQNGRNRFVGHHGHPQSGRKSRSDESRILDRRKVDEMNVALEFGGELVSNRQSYRGLSDPPPPRQ